MLLQRIDILSSRILGDETVVIDGVHVSLLRYHVAEASTRRIFERNAPCFVSQDSFYVVTIVEFVVETRGYLNFTRWVAILDDDDVIGLEERTPAECTR